MSLPNRKPLLDPGDRLAEVLFGLIMALTFTGSLSVADSGRDDVRAMLVGALGCNLAWGIIDAVFYLMGCLGERGAKLRLINAVRGASTDLEAQTTIRQALPPALSEAFEPAQLDGVRRKIQQAPPPEKRARLGKEDWFGALAVCLWVFLITFPVAVPFMLFDHLGQAMRVSNAVAVGLLFVCGCAFGRISGYRPILTGVGMVGLGSVIVALTIALGG